MRQLALPLVFVAMVVVVLGVAGFWFVHFLQQRSGLLRGQAPPLTYADMQRLEEKGEQAESEIGRLVASFDSNDEDLRLMAALTLKAIGKKAVAPVQARLADPNPKVRFSAIETLGLIGPDAAPAAEDVSRRLKDPEADVRFKAAYALGRIGVASGAIVTALLERLADPEEHVVQQATDALERLGPPTPQVVYALLAAKMDLRRERLIALAVKLGPPPQEALPVLTELARDAESQSMRGNALRLLGQMGLPAVPALREALKQANPADDFELMEALARLGGDGKELLPELSLYLLNRKFWDAEAEAMTPFKKSGPSGAEALVSLLKALIGQAVARASGEKEDDVRPKAPNKKKVPLDQRVTAVLRTLGEMGADARSAVPTLVKLMQDGERYREPTLQALGDIGPAAREEAAESVRALTKDAAVGDVASMALNRMGVR